MARRTNSTSHIYLSPTWCATTERASPAALAKFQRWVQVHNIPYWGPACVVWILDLADGKLCNVPIRTFLSLLVLPFCVLYPVQFPSQLTHKYRYCPQINYPGNNFPPHKFHFKSAAESLPPSNTKLSSSSSMTGCSPAAKAHLLPPLWPSCSLAAGITTVVTTQATLTPPGLITGKATGRLIAISMNPATTQATLTPPGFITGKAATPFEKAKKVNQGSAAAQASIIWRWMMAKQRAHKAAAAAAQAEKDRQFKAFQQELGLLLDKDGEESAPSTTQKAAARCPVVQSPQQCDGRAPGKCAAQVDPDPSALVSIPTLPPHLLTLVSNLFEPVGQDIRSTKLPVSPGLSGFPYTKSFPPAGQGAVIRLGIWHQAPHLPSQCWTLISWQWRGQVWLHGTLGYCRSGQRHGLSMRQWHRCGVDLVVLSV